MEYETIAAYLAGECDPAEKQAIEQWRKASAGNEQDFRRWQLIWQASQSVEEAFVPDTAAAWRKVNPAKVNAAEDVPMPQKLLSASPPARDNQVFIWLRNLAAMLLLVAGLGWAVTQVQLTQKPEAAELLEHTTRTATTEAFVLADGTRIWLNAHSTLRFPEQFTTSTRDIYLEGEAYFEVAHQPQKPFLVHTPESVTEVLGTTFTVRSYQQEPTVEVNLMSGKVSFGVSDKQPAQKKLLKPGQKAILHKASQSITVLDNDNQNYLAWKTNKLEFKETRLQEALEILEEYYQVEFSVSDSLLLNCRFTATFSQAPLSDVLEVFAFGSDISYRKQGNHYVLSGSGCQ